MRPGSSDQLVSTQKGVAEIGLTGESQDTFGMTTALTSIARNELRDFEAGKTTYS